MSRLSAWLRWAWTPVAALWAEIIGLRTEQIRSAAFVVGVAVLFYSLGYIQRELLDPWFALALIGMMMVFGLAWQATSIKGQWGEVMLHLGRDPDPENRVTFSDTDPENDDA